MRTDHIFPAVTGKYRLTMICNDNSRNAEGKYQVKYKLCDPDMRIIFQGNDFYTPDHQPVSHRAALALMGFLTLRPGDTDEEYFDKYTPEQLAWADSPDCEELSILVSDEEG